jgi:hypothetical protein
MAYRYWKGLPLVKKKSKKYKYKSCGKDSKARAEEILKLIRSREEKRIWHGFPEREPVENRPMDADSWQTFKKNFVDLYGGEKVKETGMTDSEFFDWFKTGKRELEEPPNKLRALLAELHAHQNAAARNKTTVKKK